jgi:hypothetical protein
MTPFVHVAIAALLAAAAADLDTVFLKNGGRLRGTVLEEDPARGVSIQIPGGDLRKLAPDEVVRVEYGDGAVRTPGAQPAPAPQPQWQPLPPAAQPGPEPVRTAEPLPPIAAPAASEPPVPVGPRPPQLVTLAASLIWLAPGGEAEAGLPMRDFTSPLIGVGLEGGLRLARHYVLGAFLDFAGGSPGPELRGWCAARGLSCDTADVKLGIMGRYAFTPEARQTPWLGLGLAFDVLMSTAANTEDTPSYGGGELLRFSAGWDYRGSGQIGLGFFGTFSTSRYPNVDNGPGGIVSIDHRTRHTWLELGVRGILFP